MAFASGNANNKFGLRVLRHMAGGVIRSNSNGSGYAIADGYNTGIFQGDLVTLTGSGNVIEVAAANARAIGVFIGCEYTKPDGTPMFSNQWPAGQTVKAGTTVQAFVYDDPQLTFAVQASAGFVAANVGAGADILAGSGDTQTGISVMQLDSGSIAVSNDKNLLILGLAQDVGNSYGTNAKVEVMIQKHFRNSGGTAV